MIRVKTFIIMYKIPILFLIFNRPQHTQQVFERIKDVKPKQLYVAADGPRESVEGDVAHCALAREIATAVDWDCEVFTLYRDYNLGCGRAVSEAINWFFESVEEGVILEDDCLIDKSFFTFAATLLHKYRDVDNIYHISANGLSKPPRTPLDLIASKPSYSFVQYPLVWGWATWRRAWKNYDFNMSGWEATGDKILDSNFSENLIKDYWKREIGAVYKNELDTWDYQWLYTCLRHGGLSIIPRNNLVKNIGFGPDATHYFNPEDVRLNIDVKSLQSKLVHPKRIIIDNKITNRLEEEVFGLKRKKPFYTRFIGKIKRRLYG
jgi:hypothetical protein